MVTEQIINDLKKAIGVFKYNGLYKMSILTGETEEPEYLKIVMTLTDNNYFVKLSNIEKIEFSFHDNLIISTTEGYIFIMWEKSHIDVQM